MRVRALVRVTPLTIATGFQFGLTVIYAWPVGVYPPILIWSFNCRFILCYDGGGKKNYKYTPLSAFDKNCLKLGVPKQLWINIINLVVVCQIRFVTKSYKTILRDQHVYTYAFKVTDTGGHFWYSLHQSSYVISVHLFMPFGRGQLNIALRFMPNIHVEKNKTYKNVKRNCATFPTLSDCFTWGCAVHIKNDCCILVWAPNKNACMSTIVTVKTRYC